MKRIDPLSPALLVADIHRLCYSRFRRATRDDGIADDLCQTLWLKLAGYQSRPEEHSERQRLLHFAATNLLRDWWRQRRRHAEEPIPEEEGELIDTATPSPEDALARADTQARVRAELGRILKNENEMSLLLTDGETSERLSERLGGTGAAIRKTRERLIKRLRQNPRLRELWYESLAA